MIAHKNFIKKYFSIGFLGIVILVLLSGCSARYGSYRLDEEVKQAFETHQLPADYQYYYYGHSNEPIVIFGIETKYEMHSVMWKNVSADTQEFRELTRWVWEDYEYYKFGAEILNPDGEKIGIIYTSVHETVFKFGANNRITVIPHTPFLWGPEGEGGDSWL
ncbi:MAG: hypothetical protein QNL14_12000 [Deltaproteobacteria bacterium]|nr:hypothetical protein [Deltaproteobacteria bacterium]